MSLHVTDQTVSYVTNRLLPVQGRAVGLREEPIRDQGNGGAQQSICQRLRMNLTSNLVISSFLAAASASSSIRGSSRGIAAELRHS